MEYIRINHSVNYVRLSDYLNDQGGKANATKTEEATKGIATFPIAFKKILTAVGTLDTSRPMHSAQNYDDEISVTTTGITFRYHSHYYIAIGL